jgi:hypothetical protein
MAKKSTDKTLSGSQLTVATAEKVFGWKNVHKHDGELNRQEAGQARADSEGAGLFQRPCSRLCYRRVHEAARPLGAIPEGAFQDYEREKSSQRVGQA